MKKIFLFLLTTIISFSSFAQNLPQGIAYQAVAVKEGPYSLAGENPQAIYWSNKDIKVRFTILDQYPNPTDTYQELHSITTDDYGVFNLIIGQGTVISGDFETIPWELGAAHLQVEIDFENEDDYTVTSFERFWSVPYAFVSKKDESTNMDSAINALNDKITYLKNRDQDTVIGNEGVTYKTIDSLNQVLQDKIDVLRANDLDTVVGNEIQTLAIKGDSLSISDGNTVKIDFPANLDNDPVNEIQNISLSNDTINLSKGGGKIALKDINDYVKRNSSPTNITPIISQDLKNCLTGTVINLEEWGDSNNYSRLQPYGEISDSIFIFSASGKNGIGAVYMHDIFQNKITKIRDSIPFTGYVGDSILYLIDKTGTNYNASVWKLKSNQSIILLNSFSDCPGDPFYILSHYRSPTDNPSQGPKINESGDLIWIEMAQNSSYKFGTIAVKKYQLSLDSVITITPSFRGTGLCQKLNGDTFLIVDKIFDTKSMKPVSNIPIPDFYDNGRFQPFYFDNHIYYNKKYPKSPSGNYFELHQLNLKTSRDIMISNSNKMANYGYIFYGTNNNNLYLTNNSRANIKLSNLHLNGGGVGTTAGLIKMDSNINFYLETSFIWGDSSIDGYRAGLNNDNLLDNESKFMGRFETWENHGSMNHCVNDYNRFYSIGYFYSTN